MKRLFAFGSFVVLMLLLTTAVQAQINISGVINEATAVTGVSQPNCSDCSPTCKDTISVNDASAFQVGDRALIIQMKILSRMNSRVTT